MAKFRHVYHFTVFLVLSLLVSVHTLPGCGKSAAPEARVLLIGLDGIEMDVLFPLLESGALPNMARLIDRGILGYLQTFEPTLSPVIWTSIATGKTFMEHGIYGFLDLNTKGPYTSNARKGKAVWNIVSDYGLKCNVTGFWITWPAEKINGIMISQVTTKGQRNNVWKGMFYKDVKDCTYPPEFIEEIWPVVEPYQTPEFIDREVLPKVFGPYRNMNLSDEVEKLIGQSKWSFAGDFVYKNAGEYLLKNYPGDLDIIYLGGTDVIGHRFWRYREPERYEYRILDKYVRSFQGAIDAYYQLADEMVGDLLAQVPDETRVIIISDHGMHADFMNGKDANGNDTPLSAHHLDAPAGVLIAAGEGIRKGPGLQGYLQGKMLEKLGTVMDVTPTLLYLLDIPVGRDMKLGKVMRSILSDAILTKREVRYMNTHDVDFRPPTASQASAESTAAFVDRFEQLGYIDDSSSQSVPEYKMGPEK